MTTPTFIDHYRQTDELRVLWGWLNGVPIYAPLGTTGMTIAVPEGWGTAVVQLVEEPAAPDSPSIGPFTPNTVPTT